MARTSKGARTAAHGRPVDPEGYGYEEARELVQTTLEAGISVLLRGHPGVGKSALAAEVAARMGLPLHDIRLAQREPAEIGGIYFPDRERQELSLLPPPWVREVCAAPGFVFLDEINAAVTRLHQAVAYQIVLERRVGPFRFHPGTVVMAAGNLEEDNALVSSLSTALNNRFAHFQLRVDLPGWIAWAERTGLPPLIVAYLRAHQRFGAELLYRNDGADAFPTPRSWEMAARVFARGGDLQRKRLVAACIGAAATEQLFAFVKLHERVNVRAIVERGAAVDFGGEHGVNPSFVHATITAVASHLAEQDEVPEVWLPHVLKFLRSPGLDPEYVFLCLRDLRRRTDLTERLKAYAGYRELASELVQLDLGPPR